MGSEGGSVGMVRSGGRLCFVVGVVGAVRVVATPFGVTVHCVASAHRGECGGRCPCRWCVVRVGGALCRALECHSERWGAVRVVVVPFRVPVRHAKLADEVK
jgi:hypothetical protein